ncbi:MAG: DUF6080 domain-containing protein [Prevotellaceae bacterium]|nr:DUF6080 domain-containing protein [Prevotellaceae bacterium]
MKKIIELLKIKREEWLAAIVAAIVFITLQAFVIIRYIDVFTQTGRGYWSVFVKNFYISGFDPITYTVITHWGANYNVYRHPLLAFFIYPLSMLNEWLTDVTGINLVQFITAVPWLVCAFYSFIFLYRIFREIIKTSRLDATLLSALYFSFAYVMISLVVPDHFGISMFLLLLTIYLSGRKMQQGKTFKIWQTVLLFFFTAGVTLSNGIKIFIYALFTNGKKFFSIKNILFAVLLPSILIWIFARWEYHNYALPKERAAKESKKKKNEEKRKKDFIAFADTTSIKDSAKMRAAFNAEIKKKAIAKYKADRKKPWNEHKGKPMGKGEFTSWTDKSTSRIETAIENLFGESIQLHKDHLLEDTLRERPVIVKYNWAINYIVEAIVVLLFLAGIWFGRRSRFLWMCLAGFAFDMVIHMGLGFGINEVYIMGAHWLFVMPIAMAFLVKATEGKRLSTYLRALILLLSLYLWIYNGTLFIDFLI